MTSVRWIGLVAGVLLLALGAAAWVVLDATGATLRPDGRGLARVELGRFAGEISHARVVTAHGRRITLVRTGAVLTPAVQLNPGEREQVAVTVRRPQWLGWALGSERTEHLAVRTPRAAPVSRWVQARRDGTVAVAFTQSVARATYALGAQTSVRRPHATAVVLGRSTPAGVVRISASARPWLRRGGTEAVTWFPRATRPVALVSPTPGSVRGPAQAVRLTFSTTVAAALGAAKPTLRPATPGRWSSPDSHTLLFEPAGYGTGLGTPTKLELPRALAVAGPNGAGLAVRRELGWKSQPGSTLRLQQLLAQQGYLPVTWTPDGADVARTREAESAAASAAPAGRFSWRYDDTPAELRRQWTPGRVDAITRGAVMMFQDDHHLSVDAIAGGSVWAALLDDAVAAKHTDGGYSYVYVHRDVPQKLTLWHDGHTVLTSPGNTGIPSAPTELGTFPVFEHLPVTTMSGTNPDGSSYNDPGIKWVSYFNGGDALHTFNRASFGTPQSLGCVELPESTARRVYPYTPIGTLVTVEH